MTLVSSPEASEAPVLKSLRTSDFGCIGDCLKKKDPFTSPPDCCSFISIENQSSSSFLCVQTCLKFSLYYFPAVPSAILMLHWPSFALRMLFAVLLCAVAPIILLA